MTEEEFKLYESLSKACPAKLKDHNRERDLAGSGFSASNFQEMMSSQKVNNVPSFEL